MSDLPPSPSDVFTQVGAAHIRRAIPILTRKQSEKLFREACVAAEVARDLAHEDLSRWLEAFDRACRAQESARRAEEAQKPSPPHVVLGVAASASIDAIQTAWRRLAREAHPDVPGGDLARMASINAARDSMLRQRGVARP